MKEEYCYGCGYLLQTEDENKLGYIKEGYTREKDIYCKRCYNMIYRNETPNVFLSNKEYFELLDDIISNNSLYVLVVDVFNIEGTLIKEVLDKLKNKQVIVVLNKKDLLPKLIKDQKLYNYIKKHPKLKGINILDIVVVSAKNKHNIDLLLSKINKYRDNDAYLIGAANVGKSSLINALINSVMGESKEYISTSYYGGTTLGLINIPFDDDSSLIDTPGIVTREQEYFNKYPKILKVLFPLKEVRPKVYQLNERQTLFLSGFVQINYLEGERQGFSIYMANTMPLHRTAYENASEFREKHLGVDIIVPPLKEQMEGITFEKHVIDIYGRNVDLVFQGIGFINFKNIEEELTLELIIPSFLTYNIREGLI